MTTAGGDEVLGRQLHGTTRQRHHLAAPTPVDVTGLSAGVAAIGAGGYHTCALTAGGGAKCWGDNGTGQLGNGTTTQALTPVDVIGLSAGVAVIAAGGKSHLRAYYGGGVKCWGC